MCRKIISCNVLVMSESLMKVMLEVYGVLKDINDDGDINGVMLG